MEITEDSILTILHAEIRGEYLAKCRLGCIDIETGEVVKDMPHLSLVIDFRVIKDWLNNGYN